MINQLSNPINRNRSAAKISKVMSSSCYIMTLIFIHKLFRYYDSESFPTTAAQKKFEKSLFTKTHKVSTKLFVADFRYDFHLKANAEIIMLDGFTCLYKSSVDLFFYVVMWLCVKIGWH